MNFLELQTAVKDYVMDQSPDLLITIPDLVNEAIQQIAEEVRFPEYKTVSTVTTDIATYYVNMSASFTGRLRYAGNSDGEYAVLEGGIEALIRLYPTLAETGDIKHLTLEGNILYYQPIPTTATVITCIGYRVPDTLVNDTDTPSVIPSYLHREAIVNKATELAYNSIEDALEGDKVNMKLFAGLAEVGLNKVRAYVSRRRPVVSRSIWSY